MRKVLVAAAVLLAVPLLWFAGQMIAAESGEVVVVRTVDAEGGVHETRLWIVEHAGASWLRAGSPQAGWFERLRARPEVEVVRDDVGRRFRSVPAPEERERINALMLEKYGWGERYINLAISRDEAVPVRLEPL